LEIEGVIELLFEMSAEVVIGVNVWWRVKDVVISGCLRVFENAGEEFCCENEATIMKRGYASFSAHANGWTSTKSAGGYTKCCVLYWID